MAKYDSWLTEEGLLQIEGWARDGLTDEQIAFNMGINVKSLYNWKKRHLPIFHALKRGKEVIDRQVENALLKRALGYEYDEIVREPVEVETEDGKKDTKLVVTKIVRKQVTPDTTAQIFWLKNRKPQQWRDKQEIQHSGTISTYNYMSDDELDKELEKLSDNDE